MNFIAKELLKIAKSLISKDLKIIKKYFYENLKDKGGYFKFSISVDNTLEDDSAELFNQGPTPQQMSVFKSQVEKFSHFLKIFGLSLGKETIRPSINHSMFYNRTYKLEGLYEVRVKNEDIKEFIESLDGMGFSKTGMRSLD